MKTLKTNFNGLEIFKSKNIFDDRGYFREVFIKKKSKMCFKRASIFGFRGMILLPQNLQNWVCFGI